MFQLGQMIHELQLAVPQITDSGASDNRGVLQRYQIADLMNFRRCDP